MRYKRKLLFLVALISLSCCLSLIQSTYAKYVSSATANSEFNLARWNILVNNQDIMDSSNFSETITPVFLGTSTIKEDVIAPQAEGYFDIIIDGTNTDVSFSYTINILPLNASTITDLEISKYTIDGTDYSYVDGIIGNIAHTDIIKTNNIRVYIKWNDDENTETMDNALDTEATINGNANYRISINFIQDRNE